MAESYRFIPTYGTIDKINQTNREPGRFYVATDTGEMFVDVSNTERITIGGKGVSLFYASDENVKQDEENEKLYILSLDAIDDADNIRIDDLILNQTDGCFYKVWDIDAITGTVYALQLSVSGGGGGGGGGTLAKGIRFKVTTEERHSTILNGQQAYAIVDAAASMDDYGEYNQDYVVVAWNMVEDGRTVPYLSGTFNVDNNVPFRFEYGSRLKENTLTKITFTASDNTGTSKPQYINVNTVELTLTKSTTFSNVTRYGPGVDFKLACDLKGQIKKLLNFYIDGELLDTKILNVNDSGTITSKALDVEHGAHTAKIELFSYDNDTEGPGPEPLEFEFAYIDPNNMTPVIWCGNYKDTYYSYDKIQIPYLVYDPVNAPNATVNFYKGSTPLESKTTVLNWNEIEDFQIFEITDAIVDYTNLYTIVCNGTSKNIIFECITDPNRDMNVISDGLILKFDAAGRSNNESSTNRQIWNYEYVPSTAGVQPRTFTGTFTGFNWYNNGWVYDENNNSCLRISNGAQFSVNLGSMILNRGTAGQQSCTFEFEFKVKNIQNYGKVIKEITRYKSAKEGVSANDNAAYEAFIAQMTTGLDNYDTFLTALYSGSNTEYVANGYTNIQAYIHPDLAYDDLEITKVEKLRDLDNAFANYFSNAGFCLGAQDGFFFDGVNSTVNVKYVEDKLVNLSIVFDYATSYIFFYLNGVLSSVQKAVGHGTDVSINANNLVFSSRSCDIDLYKFRVYNKALSVKEIDTNYAIDHRDVILYDQANWLAQPNANLGGEYQLTWQQMNYYNEQHPDDFLMPYMVIDTTNATSDNGGLGAGVLPYRKSKKTNGVHITFYNTGLEYMYEHGKLGDLAEKAGYTDIPNGLTAVQQYYMHHCPSWTSKWYVDSTTEDITSPSAINLAVQGTSSEFYPRRNYKIKTKGKDKNGDSLVYMFMNAGPFAEMYKKDPMSAHLDWFYFDNDTVGTTKYTMKVDYMESSGTYNMGFANFVHNAYTKHPLNDYNKAGAFCKLKSTNYPVATTFKEGTKYFIHGWGEEDGKEYWSKAEVQPTAETFGDGTYYTEENVYEPYQFDHVEDYRTNVQGFPVLMFHLNGDPNNSANYTFIGRYNMLLDKGSDEAFGFKPDKKILSTFCKKKAVNKIAECWEFSDNSRTYCSFNDPLGRETLSFSQATGIDSTDKTAPQTLNSPETGGAGGAPAVADSFEYRYHKDADLLDYLYAPDSSGIDIDELQEEDYPIDEYGDLHDQANRNAAFFDIYKNWEKACQWLYTTRTNNQPSQNAYKVVALTAETYEPNVYYVKTSEIIYEEATGDFDETAYYYQRVVDENDEDAVFYEFVEGLTEDQYNAGTYYLQNTTGYIKATDEEFDAKETYYQADFSYQSAQYALATPVTYGSTTYNYDTKEYRLAKFKNEFKKHFDLEYALVYFIMTEVFMCYDSRGKNCMMATWGPLEEGGDYIWYPVFYDMDTQLGINNTGIPSFEYYVNATEEGCYSTNDSVLWMNLYEAFFPEIKAKYYTMRGSGEGIVNINTGKRTTPLKGVDSASIENSKDDIDSTVEHIENWYLANPDETGCLAMLGQRPLIALNLDEYYKYISIINPKIGYQNRDGGLEVDTGTYFYALQGDRSLSRQQFLSNRLNFIDSWLNNGEYARGGSAIFGRIGCNDGTGQWYSDRFVNRESEATTTDPNQTGLLYQPYYDVNGNKANYLDGDVTVTLTPYQRSYVAIGGDNGITASEQYNGRALSLDLPSSVVEGRLNSGTYGEQLFYIYGTKSLQDIGDTSTLYWSEFYANKSPRLQRIMLGSNYPGYFNHHMNYPNLDASSESRYGKPLLKEVNLDGVWIQGDTRNFDLTSSEKLTHFEALDSNITDVAFAAGVALDTLYLPDTINSLRLTEARRLTNLLTTKPIPADVEEFRNWNPADHQGLYIDGLTNKVNTTIPVDSATESSNINVFSIIGGSLGYNSYKMLNTLYQLKSTAHSASEGNNDLSIALKDVNWCPYVKLVEGDLFDANNPNSYYEDDQHFGFRRYTYRGQPQFEKDILNGNVYRLTGAVSNTISSIELLEALRTNPHFTNTNTSGDKSVPIITGIVYVNNSTPVDEGEIANVFQNKVGGYPASTYETAGLNIFFANVTKGYSAKFVFVDPDTGMEQIQGTQHISIGDLNTKHTFDNPYSLYSIVKPHEVFNGWSTIHPDRPESHDAIISEEDWENTWLNSEQYEYTYYAIMSPETYTATFYNYDQSLLGTTDNVYSILPGSVAEPGALPVKPWTTRDYETKPDDKELYGDLTKCWVFKGWTEVPLSINGTPNFAGASGRVIDFSKLAATDHMYFMAVYEEGSVYDTELPSRYYQVYNMTVNGVQGVELVFNGDRETALVTGKICLPTQVNGKPVVSISGFGLSYTTGEVTNEITHIFWKKQNRAVIKISNNTFQGHNYLEYIEMPTTLTELGESCFASCGKFGLGWTPDMYHDFTQYITKFGYGCCSTLHSMTQIYIPGQVTMISQNAFGNCTVANYLQFGDSNTPFGTNLDLRNLYDRITYINNEVEGWEYEGSRPRIVNVEYFDPKYSAEQIIGILTANFGLVLDPTDTHNGWTVEGSLEI